MPKTDSPWGTESAGGSRPMSPRGHEPSQDERNNFGVGGHSK